MTRWLDLTHSNDTSEYDRPATSISVEIFGIFKHVLWVSPKLKLETLTVQNSYLKLRFFSYNTHFRPVGSISALWQIVKKRDSKS